MSTPLFTNKIPRHSAGDSFVKDYSSSSFLERVYMTVIRNSAAPAAAKIPATLRLSPVCGEPLLLIAVVVVVVAAVVVVVVVVVVLSVVVFTSVMKLSS